MTPDEIRAVYNQGSDAVIELVTSLFSVIAQLQQQNEQLLARVQALEAKLAKDSHNSSKPPSSDGLSKPAPKSLRTKSGNKPGGQPGHPGASLCWSQAPDQVIDHRPERCTTCGEPLTSTDTTSIEHRQVHDLPPLRVLVTPIKPY